MMGSGAFTNAMVASQAKGRPGICFSDLHAIDVISIQFSRGVYNRGACRAGGPTEICLDSRKCMPAVTPNVRGGAGENCWP